MITLAASGQSAPIVKGYQLFWDGVRVGYDPSWDAQQAVSNFRWNVETYPKKNVTALFDGEPLVYLRSVTVLPVFFVPAGERGPNSTETDLLLMHLSVAQNRYREMMKGRDTFTIAEPYVVYNSGNNLTYFRRSLDQGGAKIAAELLQYLKVNRFSLPYVLLLLVMNPPHPNYPLEGGTPLNGGWNTGGGQVLMASIRLVNKNGDFQNTLQHELGHAFGLVHTDAYGYSMDKGDSIMSYNDDQDWVGFTPPKTQGILIPEDMQALAMNKLVFPNFYFDKTADVPKGYDLKPVQGLVAFNLTVVDVGYELFFDGRKVGNEPYWNSSQAIANLLANKHRYPGKKVEGKYLGKDIVTSGTGYELYFDGIRAGHEPTWSYDQALGNLNVLKRWYPRLEVVGLYDGGVMTPLNFQVIVDNRQYVVGVRTNSTVGNVAFSQQDKTISFTVSGASGTKGYVNATWPKNLLNGTLTVTLDNTPLQFKRTQDSAHITVTVSYPQTDVPKTLRITGTVVVPEFPQSAVIVILIAVLIAIALQRAHRSISKKQESDQRTGPVGPG